MRAMRARYACPVQGCGKALGDPGVRFFHFPHKYERQEEWLAVIKSERLHKLNRISLQKQTICSSHFSLDQFRTPEKLKLNLNVVPTLNLGTDTDKDKTAVASLSGTSVNSKVPPSDFKPNNVQFSPLYKPCTPSPSSSGSEREVTSAASTSNLAHKICFAVSALASNWERLGKPFNPLLGETYELERPEFRIICEQVSHHPPVSAFHADSKDWFFHGSIHPKLKFWGKSVEIQPKGTVTVEFPKWNEAYTWTNVNCCVHNIIVGRLWMEQYGNMEIINHSTGHRANLNFKPAGSNSKDLHHVEGFITDKSKNKLFYVHGKWTEFMKCVDIAHYEEYARENSHKFKRDHHHHQHDLKNKSPNESPSHTSKKVLAKLNSLKVGPFKSNSTQESVDEPGIPEPEGEMPPTESAYGIDIPNSFTIWQANRRPPQSNQYYQFTQFAMSLNEIEEGMEKKLCPTDSRLRPDIRKLEQGDTDGAAQDKNRLEEKQRDASKARKGKKTTEWSPCWFHQGINPYTKQEDWLYNGEYWNRQYPDHLDIF